MTADWKAVIWKERKSMFRAQGRKSQTIFTLLTPILLALVMPWQIGVDWLSTAFPVFLSVLLSFILVGITIPDSFAGERERHTLLTLLASRLPDRAILIGKVVPPVLVGWGATLSTLLLSAVSVNVMHWSGRVAFFTAEVFLGSLVIGLLVALLTAGAGVLISMRAPTVQGAQQTLMVILMVPLLLLQLAGFVVLGSNSGREAAREFFARLEFAEVMLVVAVAVAVVAVVLLVAANVRFRRSRLVLS